MFLNHLIPNQLIPNHLFPNQLFTILYSQQISPQTLVCAIILVISQIIKRVQSYETTSTEYENG